MSYINWILHWDCWCFSVTTEKKDYWTEGIRNSSKKKERQELKKEAIQINVICSQHHRQPVSITNGSTMLLVGDVIHGNRQYWSLLHEHVTSSWVLLEVCASLEIIQSGTILRCFVSSVHTYLPLHSQVVFVHSISLRKILRTTKKTNNDKINVILAPPLWGWQWDRCCK